MKKTAGVVLTLIMIITAVCGCGQQNTTVEQSTDYATDYTPTYRFGSEPNKSAVKKREVDNARLVPYDGGYYFVNEIAPEIGEARNDLYYITDSGEYNKIGITGIFSDFLSGKGGELYAQTTNYGTGKSTDIIYKLEKTAAEEFESGSQYHYIYEDDAKYSYREGGNTVFRSEYGSGIKEEIFSFGYDLDTGEYINHGENSGFNVCALQKYGKSFYFIFTFGKQEKYFARYETERDSIKVYDDIKDIYGYKIDSGYIYYAVLTGGGNADLVRTHTENGISETIAKNIYGKNFLFGDGCIYYMAKDVDADGAEHYQICRKDNDLSESVIYETDSNNTISIETHDNRLFIVKFKKSKITDNRHASEIYELSSDGNIIAKIADSDES